MKENITTEIGKAQSDTTSLILSFRYGLLENKETHISTFCNSDVMNSTSFTTVFTVVILLVWKNDPCQVLKVKEQWHPRSQAWEYTMSESQSHRVTFIDFMYYIILPEGWKSLCMICNLLSPSWDGFFFSFQLLLPSYKLCEWICSYCTQR